MYCMRKYPRFGVISNIVGILEYKSHSSDGNFQCQTQYMNI